MCVEPVCLSEHHRLLGIKTGEELEHTRDTEDRREGQERDRGGAREGQGRGRRRAGEGQERDRGGAGEGQGRGVVGDNRLTCT